MVGDSCESREEVEVTLGRLRTCLMGLEAKQMTRKKVLIHNLYSSELALDNQNR